jgi:ABC-type phosphonate transport system ATPase subunit
VLRNVSEPKREEVTGDWMRVYVEQLHGLYSSSTLYEQIGENEKGGARRTYGKKRQACKSVVGKLEVKRPSGRPRHI